MREPFPSIPQIVSPKKILEEIRLVSIGLLFPGRLQSVGVSPTLESELFGGLSTTRQSFRVVHLTPFEEIQRSLW